MRKIVFGLMLAGTLYACKKADVYEAGDPEYCWRCTTTTVELIDTTMVTTTSTMLCNKTKSQIEAYIKANTTPAVNTNSSYGVPYGNFYGSYNRMTTTCSQQ